MTFIGSLMNNTPASQQCYDRLGNVARRSVIVRFRTQVPPLSFTSGARHKPLSNLQVIS